jgi:hypothetical protein
VAGCVVSALAVAALEAWDMVGNKHTVADFDAFNFAADFAYDASCLVTQNPRRLGNTVPLDNVATTDATRHHFHQDFVFARSGHRHLLDSDVMVVVVDGGKQIDSPKKEKGYALPAITCP